ncbi:hypothetical protein P4T89_05860 [Bacillus nakamurai]|uniref:Uncharacterized protein n=1 Tax=Bacillus nakamurai TaxID=1793963 RepID=A0A150F2S9_9BACI|nr:hypothetical protein [Bacillus nakamurai]KXZ13440.1 hypothetical protein AXI58_04710 [Bacillus nakamurai]MED1227135.1 hypothetical protein [Bacillus nakamurai]
MNLGQPIKKKALHHTLLEKGVSESHLTEMKRTINFNKDLFLFYYEEKEELGIFKHVPLSKIKSLGYRGSSGLSWFGHACCKGYNIDIRRSQKAFHFLEKQGLKEFQSFYNKSPVRLIYFDEDDFYAVNGDGTHRTIWAKITGAPTILAEITIAKKNPLAYEKFKNDFLAAFIFKAFLHIVMKFTPQLVESILLSGICKITDSEKIRWQKNNFIRKGFDLYCMDKTLKDSK